MHNNDPNYGREFLGGHELASYDRIKDLKVFDDTKTGVKGVVDAGALSKIPRIFVRPDDELAEEEEEFRVLKNCVNSENSSKFETPVIDLEGVAWMNKNDVGYEQRHEEIVNEIRHASETSGFFQLINHGVPKNVMDEMVKGVKRFHEQDDEAKKPMYSRDPNKSMVYFDNHFHYHKARFAEWKDSLVCRVLSPDIINPQDLPETFRDIMLEYTKHVINLGDTLVELLSEGLGLALECTKNLDHICDYYPACPEPQLTLGSGKHSDSTFFTVLLQDDIGGLQFLHQKFWVDVKPVHGSLLVNIGDLLQVISNERFKSAEHRVVANLVGPRISVASFFSGSKTYRKLCGPIKEVVQ
ncbi:hypothetical protein C5167_036389 [Papaver somniferum]|uniref:Fe2OG dioxygenase domain-containing protein n=1 Tax=Papaver somniferum TaxID=3469 RepID=A0A4Y7I719_PAPSO|nr:1-aminocyclopropane-1-carboxylate oxidase homolog 12-like [Papaver somniferum]RZC43441.1 hypothetical protein C5167_036389 [Papaver somniferum]